MSKIVKCPECSSEFDIGYARTFACSGCNQAPLGSCGMIKCPKCGKEFPL